MIFNPATFLTLYFITGLWLAISGPIIYEDLRVGPLLIYVGSFIVIFVISFALGQIRTRKSFEVIEQAQSMEIPKPRLLLYGVLLYCFSFIAFKILQDGPSALTFSGGAQTYSDFYDGYERNSGNTSVAWLLSELFYPLIIIFVGWVGYSIRFANGKNRFLMILAIAAIALNFGVMAGKQKIIGDIMIILSFALLASFRIHKPSLRSIVIIGLGLVVGFFVIGTNIAARYENIDIGFYNINDNVNYHTFFDEDTSFRTVFGEDLGFGLTQLSQYLSNGYYGLSLALSLPFEWTGFIGNSYSLMVIFERFLGGEFLLEYTYPYRVGEEYGWGDTKWHSAFAWFASDFTFPGTLAFFGVVSFIYGRAWRAVAFHKNLSALPFFVYLSIGFVFLPANNQLLISPGGIFAMVLFIFIWKFQISLGGKPTDPPSNSIAPPLLREI